MRIGIDISQTIYGTGASWYTINLISELLKIDQLDEYALFGSNLRRFKELQNIYSDISAGHKKTKSYFYHFPPAFMDILWNQFHQIPIETFIEQTDIFHSSDWTQPPSRSIKITTIHDLAPLLFPEETHPKIVEVHKRRLGWVKKEADFIIAVSNSTKNDIMKHLGISSEKIRVIYEGVDKIFQPISRSQIEITKKKYLIDHDYAVAIGAIPRKNIERAAQAVAIADSNKKLLVMGREGDIDLKKYKNVLPLGYIPRQDQPAILSGADYLLYPSLYEGFGLPILEAFSANCPVITSNLSSMSEIAGEAAILVDPYNINSIVEGIHKANSCRNLFIKRGRERVKTFSWNKMAKETLSLYQEAHRLKGR